MDNPLWGRPLGPVLNVMVVGPPLDQIYALPSPLMV